MTSCTDPHYMHKYTIIGNSQRHDICEAQEVFVATCTLTLIYGSKFNCVIPANASTELFIAPRV